MAKTYHKSEVTLNACRVIGAVGGNSAHFGGRVFVVLGVVVEFVIIVIVGFVRTIHDVIGILEEGVLFDSIVGDGVIVEVISETVAVAGFFLVIVFFIGLVVVGVVLSGLGFFGRVEGHEDIEGELFRHSVKWDWLALDTVSREKFNFF